jgi:hypothetical protein
MLRYSLDTNKIEIPFADLFSDSDTATVKFISFGEETSVIPVFLDNVSLAPVYTKDLLSIVQPVIPPIQDILDTFIQEAETSSLVPYAQETIVNGITITNQSQIYKLRNNGYVLIDGYSIQNVYDAFYFDSTAGWIITHDTITSLVNN